MAGTALESTANGSISTPSRPPAWLNALLAASVLALTASLCLLDIVSWDYWWQLRTGEWILAEGAVPRVDAYSYTAEGAHYVDIHWLFQILLHALYALGGHPAVVLLGKLGSMLLVVLLLAPLGLDPRRGALSAIALGFVLVLSAERIMPRPELPSFVFFAALVHLIDRSRGHDPRWLYVAAPIQLLWVNMHGLYALGIGLLAIHLAAEVFDLASGVGGSRARARLLGTTLLLSIAVSFVNPNGLDAVLYPIAQLGMIGPMEARALGSNVVELQPALASLPPAGLVAAGLCVALSGLGLVAGRGRLRTADWLSWLAFLYLALAARRNLAFFGILAAPLIARYWNAALDARPRSGAPRRGVFAGLVVVVLLLAVSWDVGRGSFHRRLGIPREPGLGVMQTFYSFGAMDFIRTHRPSPPIAHHMADGDLMIFVLYPDYRVMLDGRLEVYGSERFHRLQFRTHTQLRALDAEYAFGAVLVHYSKVPSQALLRGLQRDPAWKLVFVDEVSALFLAADSPAARRVPRLDPRAPDLFPPLEDAGRTQTELRARGRALFYTATRQPRRARLVMEWASARHPDIVWDASMGEPGGRRQVER